MSTTLVKRCTYYLYKEFLYTEVVLNTSSRNIKFTKDSIVNTCLVRGPGFLDKYCTVSFNKSKVKLEANFVEELSDRGLATYRYINTQFYILENFLFS
jgi:hypothetical protein